MALPYSICLTCFSQTVSQLFSGIVGSWKIIVAVYFQSLPKNCGMNLLWLYTQFEILFSLFYYFFNCYCFSLFLLFALVLSTLANCVASKVLSK